MSKRKNKRPTKLDEQQRNPSPSFVNDKTYGEHKDDPKSKCDDTKDAQRASSNSDQNKTTSKWYKWNRNLEKYKPTCELVALGIALCVLYLNGKQWKTAQDQLDEARRSFKIDERAWVGIVEPSGVIQGNGNGFIFEFKIKNFGKTPAVDIQPAFGQTTNYSDISKQEPPLNKVTSGTLMPNETMIESGPFVPASILTSIESGHTPFFVFATIFYSDIFGKRHGQEFAVQIHRGRVAKVLPIHNLWYDVENDATAQKNGKPAP